MFDAFRDGDQGWVEENIAEFWTFGGEGSTGTWIMTALGVAAMLISFWGFFVLENRKLAHQAAKLRASGALDQPTGVVVTTTTTIIATDETT